MKFCADKRCNWIWLHAFGESQGDTRDNDTGDNITYVVHNQVRGSGRIIREAIVVLGASLSGVSNGSAICKICCTRESVPYTIVSWTQNSKYCTLEIDCVLKWLDFHKLNNFCSFYPVFEIVSPVVLKRVNQTKQIVFEKEVYAWKQVRIMILHVSRFPLILPITKNPKLMINCQLSLKLIIKLWSSFENLT